MASFPSSTAGYSLLRGQLKYQRLLKFIIRFPASLAHQHFFISRQNANTDSACHTRFWASTMPNTRRKRQRKYGEVKRLISPKDPRLQTKALSKAAHAPVISKPTDKSTLSQNPNPASMFFQYNPSLGPPFRVLIDTNFINFSVKNKLDISRALLDCLAAPCTVYVTDCVIAELQKLPKKYAVALRVARDRRFRRLTCDHKGTYADDCIVKRIAVHRIYIVGTCDRDLKRRIRKVPGVPIMYISGHRYKVERLPETLAPGLK